MIKPLTDAVLRLRQRREQAQQREQRAVPEPVTDRSGQAMWVTEHMVAEILEANDWADAAPLAPQTQENSQQ